MVEEHTAGMVIAKVSGESYSRDQHKQGDFPNKSKPLSKHRQCDSGIMEMPNILQLRQGPYSSPPGVYPHALCHMVMPLDGSQIIFYITICFCDTSDNAMQMNTHALFLLQGAAHQHADRPVVCQPTA